jgi:hypothetical protein
MDITAQAGQLGHKAEHSDWLDRAIQVGLVSYGVVHLLMAWLAAQIVFQGGGGSNASSNGALHELAKSGLGRASLWVVAVGLFALCLWQALEAAVGHRDEDGGKRTFKRVTSAGKVVLYGAVGISALKTAMGSGSGSNTDGTTAKIMSMPAGPLIVGVVGLVIIGIGGYQVHRGWKEKFLKKLNGGGRTGNEGRAYRTFGKVGYISKGVALAIVGGLFVWAAATHDPKKSGGLDVALQKLNQAPFGSVLLLVVAAGIACYGLFCFAWARHLNR